MTAAAEFERIQSKVAGRERITTDDARFLWRNATDAQLRDLAMAVRSRFYLPDACTYMIMRILNSTNVCVA